MLTTRWSRCWSQLLVDWMGLWANARIFGNPDCGTVIIFHTNEPRPIVCHRYGSKIDWEREYVTTIRICPKCNKEYDTTAIYCSYHSPPVSLIEKELEKLVSSFL